jgi:hypothetical protein
MLVFRSSGGTADDDLRPFRRAERRACVLRLARLHSADARANPLRWKWAVIAAHSALQGALVWASLASEGKANAEQTPAIRTLRRPTREEKNSSESMLIVGEVATGDFAVPRY